MKISDRLPNPTVAPAAPAQTPVKAESKPEVAAPATAAPAAPVSNFTGASAPQGPVALSSPATGLRGAAQGPLPLSSPEAQVAVQKSVDFVQQQSAGHPARHRPEPERRPVAQPPLGGAR